MALAYLGTAEFAATVLRALTAAGESPALVVTPPDRKQGRGRRLAPPPVAGAAAELDLPLHQTANVNSEESGAALEAAVVDVAMVCAFGQIVGTDLLDRIEMLNVHPSLLPRWRGAAPIERAIMAGDERTGVAIIRLVEALDAGPVAVCEEMAIQPGEDFGSLAARLADLGGALAVRAVRDHREDSLVWTDQDDATATYAEKIDSAERRLDPGRSAIELERAVRALNPHVGTYLELAGDERLGVTRAFSPGTAPRGSRAESRGGWLGVEGETLVLGCADGALELVEVQPAGGRPMLAADYLRGNPAPRLRQ